MLDGFLQFFWKTKTYFAKSFNFCEKFFVHFHVAELEQNHFCGAGAVTEQHLYFL
jgi:hypothetical protein